MQKLRMIPGPAKRPRFAAKKLLSEGTPVEVLTLEAQALLGQQQQQQQQQQQHQIEANGDKQQQYTHPAPQTELELEIEQLSSTGDGLAYSPHKNHVYVVPFSIPGDRVLAKTFPQKPNHLFTHLDFVRVVRPSPKRAGITPGCKYFSVCSGCQLQMMSYEDQLKHKKTIVEKAFKYFSNLDPSRIPPVGDTVGSPLQYGYRTKLTPHYDKPPKNAGEGSLPAIGFGIKGTRKVLDIEQCPIGTPILNEGLTIERKKVYETFKQRKAGATVLLRESTLRKSTSGADLLEMEMEMGAEKRESRNASPDVASASQNDHIASSSPAHTAANGEPQDELTEKKNEAKDDLNSVSKILAYIESKSASSSPPPSSLTLPLPKPLSVQRRVKDGTPQHIYTYENYQEIKTYTSKGTDWTTEHVGEFTFESRANSFFQNNNSILPSFIRYVRENCMPKQNGDRGADKTITSGTTANIIPTQDPSSTAVSAPVPSSSSSSTPVSAQPIKYLLDAYCGSGLFAVCLSPLFRSVLGIDIDIQGVEAARHNASTNAIPNAGFIAADAEYIFADVPFPPDQTLVVIDPPRKGASVDFLRQLCVFGARRVVYVSCNVHTQARDVGMLVQGFDGEEQIAEGEEQQEQQGQEQEKGKSAEKSGVKNGDAKHNQKQKHKQKPKWRYEIESLRGFDFFPQTGHVEGVCFLDRVPNS